MPSKKVTGKNAAKASRKKASSRKRIKDDDDVKDPRPITPAEADLADHLEGSTDTLHKAENGFDEDELDTEGEDEEE